MSEGTDNEMFLMHTCSYTWTFLKTTTVCWVLRNLISVEGCYSLRFFFFIWYYSSPSLSAEMHSKNPTGCPKPWTGPNPTYIYIYTMIFLHIHPFSLKGSILQFLFGYVNCQHHHSCTSEPLLSQTRFTWTQALWHHDSQSDHPEG